MQVGLSVSVFDRPSEVLRSWRRCLPAISESSFFVHRSRPASVAGIVGPIHQVGAFPRVASRPVARILHLGAYTARGFLPGGSLQTGSLDYRNRRMCFRSAIAVHRRSASKRSSTCPSSEMSTSPFRDRRPQILLCRKVPFD